MNHASKCMMCTTRPFDRRQSYLQHRRAKHSHTSFPIQVQLHGQSLVIAKLNTTIERLNDLVNELKKAESPVKREHISRPVEVQSSVAFAPASLVALTVKPVCPHTCRDAQKARECDGESSDEELYRAAISLTQCEIK